MGDSSCSVSELVCAAVPGSVLLILSAQQHEGLRGCPRHSPLFQSLSLKLHTHTVSFHLSAGPDMPISCCFSHTARQIPRSMVVDYYETSSKCSLPAVVFITKKGRAVCANPSNSWVQAYVTTWS
uniref:C-C motif chemokine n=1 Tax=Chelonoidis abingdonii TaxID=106734 RepID=A0A8C0ILZ7_CHEAB